jgi:Domain of unknown function (DUF4331)
VIDVHPSFGINPPGPTTEPFAPEAIYELKVDTNGDGVADVAFRMRFSGANGAQSATVRRIEGTDAAGIGDSGDVVVQGAGVSTGSDARVTESGEYRFFAGWRSDPFFFDAEGAVGFGNSAGRVKSPDRLIAAGIRVADLRARSCQRGGSSMRLSVDPPIVRDDLLEFLRGSGCLALPEGSNAIETQLLNSVSDRAVLAGGRGVVESAAPRGAGRRDLALAKAVNPRFSPGSEFWHPSGLNRPTPLIAITRSAPKSRRIGH